MTTTNKNNKYCYKCIVHCKFKLIFTNVRQVAPDQILPRATNWPGLELPVVRGG